MNKVFTIYMHRNKLNNKVYVGQTCKNKLTYRWGVNGICYRHQSKFYNAIKKYGWDNFEHIVLEENVSLDDVDRKEKYYIDKFNSIKNGYNVQEGGINHRPITKRKIVYQFDLKGKFIKKWSSITEAGETLNIALGSIVKVCKHQLLSCGGYLWSYKKDIKSKRCANSNAKKVCQYDLKGNLINTYDSLKQAAIVVTGKENSKSKICNCCKSLDKTCVYGYVWRYLGDSFVYKTNIVDYSYCSRRVCQFDMKGNFIKTWKSIAEIFRVLGIRQGNIYSCCNNKRKSAGGYVWRYKES